MSKLEEDLLTIIGYHSSVRSYKGAYKMTPSTPEEEILAKLKSLAKKLAGQARLGYMTDDEVANDITKEVSSLLVRSRIDELTRNEYGMELNYKAKRITELEAELAALQVGDTQK